MLLRAYLRDRSALFFSVVLPLMFMLIFGALNFGAFGHVNVGIDDEAQNADSARFTTILEGVETLSVRKGALADEQARLVKGDRDLVIVIPKDFRLAPGPAGAPAPALTVYANAGRAQQASVGRAILAQVIDQLTFAVNRTAPIVAVRVESVNARDLRYVDFLVPGILAMTIMQLGISGVAFGLVAAKQRGVLRRIMATPFPPRRFLAAQVLQRLILAVVQTLLLLGVALLAFKVQVVGSLAELLVVTILGSVVFLCLGFALAGWATTENQVAPLTQIVTLPQLFLSGVFFATDAVPAAVRPLTSLLPLTFLADALREISTSGATLWDVRGAVLGLLVWSAIGFALAVRLFRFES
ncbi:MAG: ABC transporter permease [Candidatus Limnocylindria bacterium]|nr:ABC transporter permease [Candidatus Limnocylindria bacterium]